MIRWHPFFRRHVTENPPLLLVVSAHITETLFVSWGLPDCLVFQQAPRDLRLRCQHEFSSRQIRIPTKYRCKTGATKGTQQWRSFMRRDVNTTCRDGDSAPGGRSRAEEGTRCLASGQPLRPRLRSGPQDAKDHA